MVRRSNRRTGFTLPEVLVTVAIVAVLAAIVVPAVTQQISKGDDATVSSTITALRTATTAFVSDTKKWPGRVQDLFQQPGSTDLDAFDVAYGSTITSKWKGAYGTGTWSTTDSLDIIYGRIIDSMQVVSGQLMIYMKVPGLSNITYVDGLIDGGTGNAAGNLTWTTTADTVLAYKLTPAR